MEQWTGSKLGKEYIKAVHCNLAYLTYIQSVLKENVSESHQVRERIMERLRMHVAKYALPREFIFRRELPLTLVGKVAYRKLEEEALREMGHPVAEGES